jgi:hypothetical protein
MDAERIRDELFRITLGLWNYAKNHNPDTIERNRCRELVWLNYVAGVRESRRLVGDYIMSQLDYDKQIIHDDTVAFTDWGIDVHHPQGFWVRGNDCIHVYKGRRTSIPYRSLYSKNISNLFMAGRCHSATHIALGGTRVTRPCCAMGQCVGTAAAVAKRHNTDPRGVFENHIIELQQKLLRDGCYLLGVKNNDRYDLALSARVKASSAAGGMAPENTVNGWNRIVGGDRNAWTPDRDADGPHWIEFELKRLAVVRSVHVTFEKKSADLSIEIYRGEQWREIGKIPAGSTRRHVIMLGPVTTEKIRIISEDERPVICEIRVYEK